MSDDLNAKATVEVDFVANGLTQLISGIGQLNEQQGFSDKNNVKLEQGLTKLATQYGVNTGATNNTTKATTGGSNASNAAAKATQAHTTSLIATRYALYDVSNAIGIAGVALTGFAALAYKTAIDYQKEFAEVQRTTGETGVAAAALEQNLIGISQALPASFADITSVAALAGQLGIANSQILDFTTNVIKFSATTNVSVDASATAFGRLNALLPDVQGNYNGLGSSILKVGINSVATESQIITIAARIAGIGASAGLTSDQVIGLSGALASLGVQPYGASGTVTRLFTKIETAVSQGGAALEAFGNISHESGAQFQQAWNDDKSKALEDLFSGINAQGPAAIAAIQSLGLKSAQDLPNLLKLSQNVDLVKSSLSDAKTGLKDGSQLTESYGIIAGTVSAKLTVLTNNFQALLNAVGTSSTGIGDLIDGLNGLLKSFTAIAENPFESAILGTGVALVGLTGLTALAAAGFLRLAATAAAVTTAQGAAAGSGGIFAAALNILTGAAGRASASEVGLVTTTNLATGSMGAAATSTSAFASASVGLKAGLVGVAALIGFDLLSKLVSLGDAAKNNKLEFNEAADALKAYNKQVAAGTLPGTSGTGTQNRQQLLVQTTGSSKTGADFGSNFGPIGDLSNQLTGYTAAKESIDKIDASMGKLVKDGYAKTAAAEFDKWTAATKGTNISHKELLALFPTYEAALKGVSSANKAGVSDQDAATQAVTDALSASSDVLDATLKQENALYSLGDSLGQTGKDFSEYSANGRTNLSDLEAVVAAVSSQTAGDAQATANNLQGLFNALTQGAQIPAAALTFLSDSIANLGVKAIVPTTFDLASFNQGLGDGTATAAKKAQSAANSAAKAVHTLVDYGNDLSGVFTRAFDIRYSGGQALDTITKGWSDIAAAAKAANEAEAKAKATLDSLAADKGVDQYYLSVANAYGDTLRAAELQAQLAQNATDTASANDDLKTAQDGVNKTLIGNSDAAIANRATILGLVTDYQSYISALASSGLSQAQLSKKTGQLKADFIAQATQLGFNKTQLGTYSKSFDDVSLSIARVPRNITVNANTNPAIQALNEFVAKAAKAGSDAGSAFNKGFSSADTAKAGRLAALYAQIKVLSSEILPSATTSSQVDRNVSLATQIAAINAKIATGNYASGGYTGNGGKYDVAGVVHRGEYVFSKEATSRIGVNNLAYAHSMAKNGFAEGGYAGMSLSAGSNGVVEVMAHLSAADRKLLIDGFSQQVYAVFADSDANLARHNRQGNQDLNRFGGR